MEIKINTINAQGLPTSIAMRRQMRILLPKLILDFKPMTLQPVGEPPFSHALDTVIWFAYGEKPEKF